MYRCVVLKHCFFIWPFAVQHVRVSFLLTNFFFYSYSNILCYVIQYTVLCHSIYSVLLLIIIDENNIWQICLWKVIGGFYIGNFENN